jgi:hypothetical protein
MSEARSLLRPATKWVAMTRWAPPFPFRHHHPRAKAVLAFLTAALLACMALLPFGPARAGTRKTATTPKPAASDRYAALDAQLGSGWYRGTDRSRTAGPLRRAESIRFIVETLHDERTAAERAVVTALADACADLPPPLRSYAARLTANPHWTLSSVVARLFEDRTRLAAA